MGREPTPRPKQEAIRDRGRPSGGTPLEPVYRQLACVLVLAALAVGALALLPAGAVAQDCDAAECGQAGTIEWNASTDGEIRSSPTIVDDTVYVGSEDGHLYAFDEATGEERWRFETDDVVRSSPTVANGTVYVGSNDGHLYAVDAETGEERWRFDTREGNAEYSENAFVDSSPTYADGAVYFGVSDTSVYAVDAGTGEERWNGTTNGRIDASPTVVEGTVYVGSVFSRLYAFDAETGERAWYHSFGDTPLRSSPTVVDDTVYVAGSMEGVFAVNATTGEEVWRDTLTNVLVSSSPTVVDSTVYVGTGEGEVVAYDAESGERRWNTSTGEEISRSSPTVVDETLFVGIGESLGDDPGALLAVDAETGEERWRTEIGTLVRSSPTVADGTVYVGADDGSLYAIDAGVNGSSEGSRVQQGTLGHVGDRGAGEVAEFEIDDVEYSGPVEPRSDVGLEVTIANEGDAAGSDTVAIESSELDCSPDEHEVSLDSGAAITIHVSCTVPHHAAGEALAVSLSTSDDAVTTAVGVTPAPDVVEWTFSTDESIGASPTIVGDTAYVAANTSPNDGTLYAVDVTTSEEQWSVSTPGGLSSAPQVADGRVYVGTRHGNLRAFDADTGEQRWNVSLGLEEYVFDEIKSSPTYANGTVYVGTQDFSVHAVDARTGAEQWSIETNSAVRASPVVVDGTVYVGDTSGYVHAIDAATGETEWEAREGSDLRSSATVVGDTVYVGYNDQDALVALDAATGEERWTAPVGEAAYSSPTVANVSGVGETVYVGAHSLDNSLYAFDAETGEQRWKYRTDNAVTSSPTVVGDTVFVGSLDGSVYALDAASGEERWQLHVDGSVGASPTAADGTVYVGSYGGTFYALDAGANGSSEGSRVQQGALGHVGDRGLSAEPTKMAGVAVTDAETGYPVENATVSAEYLSARTAEDGVASLELAVEETELTVSAEGYESTNVTLEPDQTTVTVALESEPIAEDCAVVAGTEVCDLTGDGTYRDVNADGDVSNGDVTAFFGVQHTPPWNNRPKLFDFDGNGDVGQSDVIDLFEYVNGS